MTLPEVGVSGPAFLSSVLGFGRELKREGLTADLAAVLDFVRALDLVDIGDREEVRAAGAALFIRRKDEIDPYERAFERFWRGRGIAPQGLPQLTSDRADIDPQALSSTADNALANQVRVQVQATSAPLAPADVVLANILANPLKVLAPALVALLRPGATLVLAGLLERQVEEVSACYPEVDLRVADCVDGWACLAGRRVR